MSIRKRKAILARTWPARFAEPGDPWAWDRQRMMDDVFDAAMSIYVGEGVRRLAYTNRTATDEELREASR